MGPLKGFMSEEDEKSPQVTEGNSKDKGDSTPEGGEKPILGRFKSQADLEKSYTELEKKLGGWKEKEAELEQLRGLQEQVAPLVNFVWSDKDTLERYRQTVVGQNPKPAEDKDKKTPNSAEAEAIRDVVLAQENQVVSNFEKSRGLDALEDDERKQIRSSMGKVMARWLGGRPKPSLAELPGMLEDAYTLVSAGKLREAARNEGAAEAMQAQLANLGAVPTSAGKKTQKTELSSEEKKIARKMGLTEEDYLSGKEKLAKSKQVVEE